MENKLDLYPNYGLWHQPFWQTTWFFYTMVGVAALLILGFVSYLVVLYKKKRSKKQPWEIALIRLKELQHLLANSSDERLSKEFYLRMTIIIKNYLYMRYSFDVESKTDEELIRFLETTTLDQDIVKELRVICEEGSQAKFAPISVMHPILMRDLNCCMVIIKKTIPQNPQGKSMKFSLLLFSILSVSFPIIAMNSQKKAIGSVIVSFGDEGTSGCLSSSNREISLDLGRHYGAWNPSNYYTETTSPLKKYMVVTYINRARLIEFETGEQCKVEGLPDDSLDNDSPQMQVINSFNAMLRGYIQELPLYRYVDYCGVLPSTQRTNLLTVFNDKTWKTSYKIRTSSYCDSNVQQTESESDNLHDTCPFSQDALKEFASFRQLVESQKQ